MPDWRTVLPDANARGFGSEKSSRVYEGIRIPAKVAEHWPDQWLREGFRRIEQTHHGARWRILDVPLYVNYISNDAYKCSALHTTDTKRDRIDALVHSLEATPPDERRNLVVVMTGYKRASPYNGTRTGMRLLSLLVSLNATLLTVDTFFALKMQQEWAWKHTLVVPYAPHRTLGARTDPPPALHQRTLVAYFRGKMTRRTGPSGRTSMLELAHRWTEAHLNNSITNSSSGYGVDYVQGMLGSIFCLVPEGDTTTSRRLFDALAAGCVPVVIAKLSGGGKGLTSNEFAMDANLPYTNLVDWARIAIFVNGLRCLDNSAVAAELACELGRLASEVAPASIMPIERCNDGARDDDDSGSFLRNLSGEDIVAMQAAGVRAYHSAMHYGVGWPVSSKARYGPAAEAVLRELGYPPGESR